MGSYKEQLPEATYEQLVELVSDMMARRFHKGTIKAAVKLLIEKAKLEWDHRKYEGIANDARELMRMAAGETRETAREKAIAFYENVLRDEGVDARTKIAAQERLDKLLGLESKHDKDDDADATAKRIREALRAMENAYANGTGEQKG